MISGEMFLEILDYSDKFLMIDDSDLDAEEKKVNAKLEEDLKKLAN